jgi:hypothetical protein
MLISYVVTPSHAKSMPLFIAVHKWKPEDELAAQMRQQCWPKHTAESVVRASPKGELQNSRLALLYFCFFAPEICGVLPDSDGALPVFRMLLAEPNPCIVACGTKDNYMM